MIKLSFGPLMDTKEQIEILEETLEDGGGVGVFEVGGFILLNDEVTANNMLDSLIALFEMMGYDKSNVLKAIKEKGKEAGMELKKIGK